MEGDDVSDGAGNDDQRSDGESIAGFSSMPVAVGDDSPETDSVRVMQLKLALVREERERERERDERARLAREREFQIEKERLCLRDSRGPTPMHPVRPEVHNILPKMSNDDPLVFFQSFERALLLNDVAKSPWSRYLPANLTPKANKVLAGLSLDEVKDYEACKRSVLNYFQLNSESYLKRFRSARKAPDENYKMFSSRLRDLLLYYVESKEIDSFDALADAMLSEQFLYALEPDVKQFVLSRQPKTADECSQLDELYHEMSRNVGGQGQGQGLGPVQGHDQGPGQVQPPAKAPSKAESSLRQTQRNFGGPKPVTGSQNHVVNKQPASKKPTLCYVCNSPTHKYIDCPQRSRYNAGM